MKKVLSCTVGLLFACLLSSSLVFLEDAVAASDGNNESGLDVHELLGLGPCGDPEEDPEEVPPLLQLYPLEEIQPIFSVLNQPDCGDDLASFLNANDDSVLEELCSDGFGHLVNDSCWGGGRKWKTEYGHCTLIIGINPHTMTPALGCQICITEDALWDWINRCLR